jgi:hypothetical protein
VTAVADCQVNLCSFYAEATAPAVFDEDEEVSQRGECEEEARGDALGEEVRADLRGALVSEAALVASAGF